jgi:hypothetical protein
MTNPIIKAKHLPDNGVAPDAISSPIDSAADPDAFPDPDAFANWASDPTVVSVPSTPPPPAAPSGVIILKAALQPPEVTAVSAVPVREPRVEVTLDGINLAANASSGGLAFQNNLGLDGTFATLTQTEQDALQTDVQQAEADLSAQFTNTFTANVDFEVVNDSQDGFNAANQASAYVIVPFATYADALQNVATTTYQTSAVAAIENLTDLGQDPEVDLPDAYARMLGLSDSGTLVTIQSVELGSTQYALSASMDDTIFLNTAYMGQTLDLQSANTPNDGVVGVIEHELTENVMGRIGELGQDSANLWGPTDFFRVDGNGTSYLTPDTGGSAGTPVFFSPAPGATRPVSSLQFNNVPSNGDLADWTYTSTSDPDLSDPFGPGDFQDNPASPSLSSVLSPTDVDLMNVLGWTLASAGGTAPRLTVALKDDTGASATDNVTSDPTLDGVAASNATIALTENGAAVGTATADAGGGWTFKPALADGKHTIVASEAYGAGQTVTASITFTLATEAPAISASESVSGQTSQTSDTIAVSATAENVGANAIAGVEIFDGKADLGAATLSNGSWTFTVQNLLPGAHDFTATAKDTAGNAASQALPAVTVTGTGPVSSYTLSDLSFTGDGVTDIRPKGINDSGEIVGYYIDARPDDIGADGQTYYEHGFYSTLSKGVRQYFSIDDPDPAADAADGEPPSPDRTRAFSVNDKGEIVGWFSQDEFGVGDNGVPYELPDAGYIDSANWPGTFGTLGYTAVGDFGTHALGIDSSDQIVGYYVDAVGEEHGFLRDFTGYGVRGNYVSLDPTGSIDTVAEGIDDSGEIVGFYETSDLAYHGFSYNSVTGVYTPIDVNGATSTEALGVNNSGEIVGMYIDSSGITHGFVRGAAGQFTTIDDPNAGSGGTLVGGIDNEGTIVGWYTGADGHSHGFVGVASAAAPQIAGTAAGQTTTSNASIEPFAKVTIGDTNADQTETVTVTLSKAANGALSNLGAGSYDATTGVYAVSGSTAAVTAALDVLVFTPTAYQVAPGQTVTTTFTIADTDTAGQSVSDSTTSVIATAVATPPTIAGAKAGQPTTDTTAVHPLSGVTISDPNIGQTETVTVTLSAANDGGFSNLGGGTYNATTGVYTDTGSAAAVTTALDGLAFTPTAHQVAPGGTVTTGFAIADTDTAGQSASNNTASVIVTTGTVAPTISGTVAGRPDTGTTAVAAFSGVAIGDLNFGQVETVTVTPSVAGTGTLSNTKGGTVSAKDVYTVTGSAAAVTTALDALTFTPGSIAAGQTATTSFTIADTDTAGASASDSSTSVIDTGTGTVTGSPPFYLSTPIETNGTVEVQLMAKAGDSAESAQFSIAYNPNLGSFLGVTGPAGWQIVPNPTPPSSSGTIAIGEIGTTPIGATADAAIATLSFLPGPDATDFPVSGSLTDWVDATGNESTATVPLGPVDLTLDGTLSGTVYSWKNHAVLSGVTVAAVGSGDPAGPGAAPMDLRNVSVDASGQVEAQLWANAGGGAGSFQATLTTAGTIGASFQQAASLPSGWTVQTNAATPGALTVGGIGLTDLTGPVELGTVTWTLPAGTTRATIALTSGEIGNTAATPLAVAYGASASAGPGVYSVSMLPADTYSVTASAPANNIGNAVTAADALAALKIAVGSNPNPTNNGTQLPVSPYQYIAADINGNGLVTAADALEILKIAVGLPTAQTPKWEFLPETETFWNAQAGTFTVGSGDVPTSFAGAAALAGNASMDLVGVLTGDANGSLAAPSGAAAETTDYFAAVSAAEGNVPLTLWGLPAETGPLTVTGTVANDTLYASPGATLTGEGQADTFRFLAMADSPAANQATIANFSEAAGDIIDLSAIDARDLIPAGVGGLSFIGAGAFSGAGQLRYFDSGDNTVVQGSIHGTNVDFQFQLSGSLTLHAGDFRL